MLPVAGPSINRLDLARLLLTRQVRLVSKRTMLGVLLPLLVPVILFVLYTFVFHTIFKVHIVRYPVYLFAGLLPWTYLSQNLGRSVVAISSEAEFVRRVRFPCEYLVLASTGSGIVYLLITLAGFVVILGATGHLFASLLPYLVFPIVAVYLFVSGLSLVLALIDVYNRDLRMLLGNIITVWFFAVPVVYSQATLNHHLGVIANDDPVSFIVGEFREILYWGGVASPAHTAAMMTICGGFFLVCLLVFRWLGRSIAKDV